MFCMKPGEKVHFTKFDGGEILGFDGSLVELTNDFVKITYDGSTYSFRRSPGSKSGWGTGCAKNWRLSLEERKKYCHPDLPTRK